MTAVRCPLRVPVASGVTLYAERWEPSEEPSARSPFVLVHGLASNLRLWDGVAERLYALGHTVVAVDQRGHGRSDAPDSGYDLDAAVSDLLALLAALGLERPILAGQSWGGNVVLELACRRGDAVHGIACVDGGIIELVDWFPTWEACLEALTPPRLDGLSLAELEARIRAASPDLPDRAIQAALGNVRVRRDGTVEPRLARSRHLQILRALWEHRPSRRYAGLETPTLLILADTADPTWTAAKRRAEALALGSARRIRSHWLAPAHHDVHAQQPERVADLLAGAVREGFFG
jgi:pimeloyl-ACP methyl ester carboxylesterase